MFSEYMKEFLPSVFQVNPVKIIYLCLNLMLQNMWQRKVKYEYYWDCD